MAHRGRPAARLAKFACMSCIFGSALAFQANPGALRLAGVPRRAVAGVAALRASSALAPESFAKISNAVLRPVNGQGEASMEEIRARPCLPMALRLSSQRGAPDDPYAGRKRKRCPL